MKKLPKTLNAELKERIRAEKVQRELPRISYWRFIKAAFLALNKRRHYAVLLFDSMNPPVEGDTITVGNMRATFEKMPPSCPKCEQPFTHGWDCCR